MLLKFPFWQFFFTFLFLKLFPRVMPSIGNLTFPVVYIDRLNQHRRSRYSNRAVMCIMSFWPGALVLSLHHRYTTLNRDWKQIMRANMFQCKKRDSVETMHVSLSTSPSHLQHIILSRARVGY